jgi:hypothetical protein
MNQQFIEDSNVVGSYESDWRIKSIPSYIRRQIGLTHEFPKIIILCGSTRFKKEYEEVQAKLSLQGNIVISVGLYGHLMGLDMSGDDKKRLDQLHMRKIDLADIVYIINGVLPICVHCRKPVNSNSYCEVCDDWAILERTNYIGESTCNEIEYAKSLGKPIEYLNPVE